MHQTPFPAPAVSATPATDSKPDSATGQVMLTVRELAKNFTLHAQGGVHIAAFSGLNLEAYAGRCLARHGPSGAGKSTLMRCLYANYKACSGSILVRHRNGFVDMVTARPRAVLDVRRETMGYVSQFLRVIPRVSTLDLVAEPLLEAAKSAAPRGKKPPCCWTACIFRNASGTLLRPRFQAANSNASTLRAVLSGTAPCCCWTNLPLRWTRPTNARWSP